MIKNLRLRLITFVTQRTKPPTIRESIQAALLQMFAYTLIIGGVLYLASTSDDLQPAPSQDTKAQIKAEQATPNSPDFHTHRVEAQRVCKGKVAPSGDNKFANWVIVVKQNGKTVRMPLDRAFKLNQNQDTNVWVIGICKKDLLDNPLQ